MTVLCVILAVLLLLGLIPVGVDAGWNEEGLKLFLRVWRFSLRLGGGKKASGDREKKEEDRNTDVKARKRTKRRPSLTTLRMLAENGYRTLCRLLSRLRVELLRIHFTAAWDDPALTAMAYGAAGTAMEGLLAIAGERIGKADLRADADFDRGSPKLDFRIRLTIRVFRLIGSLLGFGCRVLRDMIRLKKEMA